MCKQSVQIRTSVRVRCMPNRTSEKPGLLKILSERRGEEFRESSTKCFSYRKDCTKQNSVHLVSLRLIWMCHYIWLDHKVWTTVWNDISQVQCKHEPGTAARHSHRRLRLTRVVTPLTLDRKSRLSPTKTKRFTAISEESNSKRWNDAAVIKRRFAHLFSLI